MIPIIAICMQVNNLPSEIQSAKEERSRFMTAYAEWTVDHGDYKEWFNLQVAGDTIWERNWGDKDGFHPKNYERALQWEEGEGGRRWGQTKEMYKNQYMEPQHRLLYDGEVWKKEGSAEHASHWAPNLLETTLGFGDWGFGATPEPFPLRIDGCGSSVDGSRRIVSCHIQNDKTIEWVLDTERGSQPVSTTVRDADYNKEAWSRSELKNLDGRWLPDKIEFFRAGEEDSYETMTMLEASFDQNWHRQEPYDPNDLGIGLGHQIGAQEYWDGASVIGKEEYLKLRYLYDMPRHPDVVKRQAQFLQKSVREILEHGLRKAKQYKIDHAAEYAELLRKRAAQEKDEWDAYTEKFIREHKLSKPKKALAERILGSAKKLRDVYRDKQTASSEKARYDAIEKRIFDRLLVRNLRRLK